MKLVRFKFFLFAVYLIYLDYFQHHLCFLQIVLKNIVHIF